MWSDKERPSFVIWQMVIVTVELCIFVSHSIINTHRLDAESNVFRMRLEFDLDIQISIIQRIESGRSNL